MSKTIDERVVEMRFDNKQFESNVRTSMSTIEKLKKSLDMDGATKGLESVDKAAKNIDMSGLGSAVESVRLKFSALEVIAVTALSNITNSAINTGKKLIASLTVDRISDGWNKLAQKTTSVATLISQGYEMSEVEEQLNRLNWFTDETSYNFTDMVDSISKFTAAGQDLETSVSAMEGIANWAALSGQNASTASRAMYQLSQAMGAGVMRLEDYKSIQTANMDTDEFRQKCIDAAIALGTLQDNADGTYTSIASGCQSSAKAFTKSQFTTQLTSGAWLTSEVMMKVFNDYGAAVDQIYEYSEEKGITASQAIKELGDNVDEFGLKAFRAAQEAKTFSDAIDATKDAVSTGWMNTFELIFGNYEEQRVLWTDLANALYDAFAAGAEDRNAMLETWAQLGGRTTLIETFWAAWENLGDILRTVKEAFHEVFPKMTGERLYAMTEALKAFVEKTKLSETVLANLKSTFKGLFAILDIVKQAFSALFTAVKPLFAVFGDLGDGILGFTGGLGNAIVKFDEFIKSSGAFQKVGEGIAKVLNAIVTALQFLKNKIKEKLETINLEVLHNLLARIHTRMSQVGEAAVKMRSLIAAAITAIGDILAKCQFLRLIEAIWNAATKIIGGIIKALGNLGKAIAKNLGEGNFSGIIDLLNGISLGAIALGITKFINAFRKVVDDIGSVHKSIIGILDSVRGCFEAYQKNLKAATLMKIAVSIAILAAALVVLSMVDSSKLNRALGAIAVLFADLLASMAVFNKISGKATGVVKSVTAMLGIAMAVLILAGALKKIADLDAEQLMAGLIGIAGMSAMMVAVAKVMSTNSKAIIKGATQMVIFAVAIKILASACKQLAQLDWEQLAKGLVGVGVLLAEVSLFLRTAKFSGKSIATATGIVILAAAMKILASACKDFGKMAWEEIGKGLASIGVLLAEITAFTKLTGNAKHVISTGISLIAIAAAMEILASAMKDFSGMQWNEIARGLTAMAGALAAITAAVNFMPKNMVGVGVGLIAVSAALLIIAKALDKMGGFSWEEIGKGLVALGGSIAILAIGLNAMKGTLGGSAALLVATAALLVLTPVLAILGAMSWESIIKGLVSLAGAFAIIGIAGYALAPVVPVILGLAGALTLIGIGILAAGAGLLAFGLGLTAVSVGITALAGSLTVVVSSLVAIVKGIVVGVIEAVGEGFIKLCEIIAGSASALGSAVKTIVLTVIDVLVECVPTIADGALKLVAGVLKALVEYTPSIVDSVFKFLIAVLEGIVKHLPSLIQAAVDVLMAFFSGIVDALKGIDSDTLLQGIVGVGLLAAIMAALSAVAALIPGAMAGVLGMGAVIAELALVLAAIGALAQLPGLNWLIGEGGELLQGIGTAIGKFVGGIVGGFMSGVTSQFPRIASDLSAFMTNLKPFLDGAGSITPSMLDGVKALAETILILTAANILDGLTSWFTGGSSLSGFAKELVPFGKAMKQFSDEISDIDGDAVSNAAIAGKTLAEMADTLPNSGGVLGFFAGENDMEAFGEQLVPFGKAMKAFSVEVDGLKTDVIQQAATAGKAMIEMASTIPNSGGVVGFFTGENDMDTFGEQLVPFGKAMKAFSVEVDGLKADVIQNSVVAGKALLELAKTVPNTGGVVAWFTGDNDLETFGEQLVPFGKAMKNYSTALTGISPDVVVSSATAAKALVELANTLPNTGGIVSWFTGDKNIGDFGKSLAGFGKSFAAYYNSISGVNVSKLSGVVVEFRNLVDLANSTKKLDTSGMSSFAQNLKKLGAAGIDEFIGAFTNANSRVSTAANTMVVTFINAANAQKGNLKSTFTVMVGDVITAFTSQYSKFTIIGQSIMGNLISGIRPGEETARSTFTTIVSGCLTAITNKLSEFNMAGKNLMNYFISGIRAKTTAAKLLFDQIASDCLSGVRSQYTDFYNAGSYLVEGFAAGITANTYLAKARARYMAQAAAAAAAEELQINSLSEGFVNSLDDYADISYEAGVATSAKEGLRNAVSQIGEIIEDGIDSQPTIKPVLDLSEVSEGAGKLSALLSSSQATKISAAMEREGSGTVQNGNTAPATGNTYNFTQNNYSPKSLSRIDIYRQTKNQFSELKGVAIA